MPAQRPKNRSRRHIEDLDNRLGAARHHQLAIRTECGRVGDVLEPGKGLEKLVRGRAVHLHTRRRRHREAVRRHPAERDPRHPRVLAHQHWKLYSVSCDRPVRRFSRMKIHHNHNDHPPQPPPKGRLCPLRPLYPFSRNRERCDFRKKLLIEEAHLELAPVVAVGGGLGTGHGPRKLADRHLSPLPRHLLLLFFFLVFSCVRLKTWSKSHQEAARSN